MKLYLSLVRREFQEYFGLFVLLPVGVTIFLILIMLYTAVKIPADNLLFEFGMLDEVVSEDQETGQDNADQPEYVIDFFTGDLRIATEESDASSGSLTASDVVTASLYGIHYLFLSAAGFVVFFYLLYSLYADRKDRSILFWKSMPVSEIQNIGIKFLVAVLAIPLIATVLSWIVQGVFLVLAMNLIGQSAPDSWTAIWSNITVLPTMLMQLYIILWIAAWLLPINAWLIFASALARREPFLIAVIPVVGVILFEVLVFGSSFIGRWIGEHFIMISLKTSSLLPETITAGQSYGGGLGTADMLAGIIIAGVLLGGAIWLRNHRFEL